MTNWAEELASFEDNDGLVVYIESDSNNKSTVSVLLNGKKILYVPKQHLKLIYK